MFNPFDFTKPLAIETIQNIARNLGLDCPPLSTDSAVLSMLRAIEQATQPNTKAVGFYYDASGGTQ